MDVAVWFSAQLHRTVPSAVVLTGFVVAIAYARSQRLKALIYSMPVPFSCAYLATGLQINPTHITGLIMVMCYNWAVYLLHIRLKLPLLLAIAVSAGGYFLGGMALRPLAMAPIWTVVLAAVVAWLVNWFCYRPMPQPEHRSRTPWFFKAPLIFALAMVIYNATQFLAGAVGTFPYAGVFTSYEMRHSLRTLAGQFAINALGILLCMVTIALTEPHLPEPWPLIVGWLPVLMWAALVHSLRLGRMEEEVEFDE